MIPSLRYDPSFQFDFAHRKRQAKFKPEKRNNIAVIAYAMIVLRFPLPVIAFQSDVGLYPSHLRDPDLLLYCFVNDLASHPYCRSEKWEDENYICITLLRSHTSLNDLLS